MLPSNRGYRLPALGACLVLGAMSINAFAGTFTLLGGFPSEPINATANGVSPDGSTVAGAAVQQVVNTTQLKDAYIYAGGMQALSPTLDVNSNNTTSGIRTALGVSNPGASGATVVGFGYFGNSSQQGYIWRDGTFTTPFGTTATSSAEAVSADGNTVVGYYNASTAFVYSTQSSTPTLQSLPNNGYSNATAVNDTGTVIAGVNGTSVKSNQPVLWTNVGGTWSSPTAIPLLSNSQNKGKAAITGISTNGSVVVGSDTTTASGNPYQAYLWNSITDSTAPLQSTLTGGNSKALDVSGDGTLVVGQDGSFANQRAVIWVINNLGTASESSTEYSLSDYLANMGISIPAGTTLLAATGISADGNVIVGDATDAQGNNEAFTVSLVAVPEPASLFALSFVALAAVRRGRRR